MKETTNKQRAPRNRTIILNDGDISWLKKRLIKLDKPESLGEIENKTIHQDIFEALEYLPDKFVNLVFVGPILQFLFGQCQKTPTTPPKSRKNL